MLVLEIKLTAEKALDACRRRVWSCKANGNLPGALAAGTGTSGSRAAPGTLELSEWQGKVWVKVHPMRDGGWAGEFARELAATR